MTDEKEREKNGSGQSLVEYALVLVLVALVCVTALSLLGRETERLIPTNNQWEGQQEE
ncbi:MAG: hypothetical protein ACOC0A_02720 [Planctomycetota bacterium]